MERLMNPRFKVANWYARKLTCAYEALCAELSENNPEYNTLELLDRGPLSEEECKLDKLAWELYIPLPDAKFMYSDTHLFVIELNGQQIPAGTYPALQRGAAVTRDFKRLIPKPVVIVVHINGKPARVLLDSGSLSDFMSVTLVDQLRLPLNELEKPIVVQLVVQGSRSKVNCGARARLQYQSIDEDRHFDIINLQNYDLVLGTPFMFQHKTLMGLVREDLKKLARPLCAKASETGLPPLRAINHSIPLIDEKKIYPWRPSRCPEPMRLQWAEKRRLYLASGRWQVTSAGNTVPMLFIRKPGSDKLRTVVDLRECNKNTVKLTSPLPDMEGILRRVASKKYRSIMDGQDAYEQIHVIPEHVPRTAMTTPDGNMVSHVLQQGDCNAPATYQAVMNYIFGEYLGKWMDVYLDDIILYSDSLSEHIENVKTVLKILE